MLGGNECCMKGQAFGKQSFLSKARSAVKKKIILFQLLLFIHSHYLLWFSAALDNVLYYQVYKLIE